MHRAEALQVYAAEWALLRLKAPRERLHHGGENRSLGRAEPAVPLPISRGRPTHQTPRLLPHTNTCSCGRTVASNQRSCATLSTSQRNRWSNPSWSTD